jgi:GNAT superfamily N-acetyltransferase
MNLHSNFQPRYRLLHASRRVILPCRCPDTTTEGKSLASIKLKRTLRNGTSIVIRPLSQDEALVNETAELLTEAFVLTDASRKIELYARFLRREIFLYIISHLRLFPKTLILGAFESPSSGDNVTFSSSDDDDQEGCAGDLIGIVEVSFSSSTRALAMTNNAPESKPYLCNMAVKPSYQRKGLGSLLIEAVEIACFMNGFDQVYLHLRLRDVESAGELYQRTGFVEVGQDPFWIIFFGQERKKLMLKTLKPSRSTLKSSA